MNESAARILAEAIRYAANTYKDVEKQKLDVASYAKDMLNQIVEIQKREFPEIWKDGKE